MTPEHKTRLAELVKAGVLYKDIGRELGISNSHISNIRRELGLPRRMSEPTMTRARLERFVELWEQGKLYREIGAELGISMATVQCWRDKTEVLRRHAPRRGPRVNTVRVTLDVMPADRLRLQREAKAEKISLGEWLRLRMRVPYSVVVDNVD